MANEPEMSRLAVSVPEAGRALGIGRNRAYEAAASGELPTLRFGKRIVVPIAALERMLAAASRSTEAA